MGDGFKRVQPGQRLAIPARAYNAMLETAEAYQRNKTSGGDGTGQNGNSNSVYIKNNSSYADVDRFGILGISDVVFSPADADALPQFKNKVVLTGDIPNIAAHSGGRFAICEEPIPHGSIGRALVYGVSPVQINVIDETNIFADIKDYGYAYLNSTSSGAVSILWKEAGTGLKWAIVKLGTDNTSIVRARVYSYPSGSTLYVQRYNSIGMLIDPPGQYGEGLLAVKCIIVGSGGNLNNCIPSLNTGNTVFIAKYPEYNYQTYVTTYSWYCTQVFQTIYTGQFFQPVDAGNVLKLKIAGCA